MFVNEVIVNRRPGGNGAVSDQPTECEQVVTIVRRIEASEGGWVQLCGPGKFMTITSAADNKYAVTVTEPGKPPKRTGLGRVDLPTALEAARRFTESGQLHEKFTWAAA